MRNNKKEKKSCSDSTLRRVFPVTFKALGSGLGAYISRQHPKASELVAQGGGTAVTTSMWTKHHVPCGSWLCARCVRRGRTDKQEGGGREGEEEEEGEEGGKPFCVPVAVRLSSPSLSISSPTRP
ncbi:hypothetical protein EYF80_022299 [Liparis tanakae]|uniref:Uncharacterized protein n=1 Tax=Liparis tanakae TaxID=230148 RepID=A0A4Z2HR59_9TELE|nr:hypothetical protein EYF80_022299 [Liparis tanakae]